MQRKIIAIAALAGLIATPVFAADMPLKAPPPPPAPIFSWTGFYIGAEGGWGQSRTNSVRNIANASFPVGFAETFDENGILAGVDFGANYQINQFVFGVEGDLQWSGMSATQNVASPLVLGRFTVQDRDINWVDTVTGRIGWAWDRWLLYAKGGGAWRRVNGTASNATFSGAGVLLSNEIVNPNTQSGYVVGGGLEWAPSEIVSFKVEGDWYNFGSGPFAGGVCLSGGCGGPGAIVASETTNTSREMWEIKGGINLHLNFLSGGLAAR